jgi:two-component system phosphate regulon sensor histidine kinase PhoR
VIQEQLEPRTGSEQSVPSTPLVASPLRSAEASGGTRDGEPQVFERGTLMWSSRLFWKLFATYAGLILLVAAVFVGIIRVSLREALIHQAERRLQDALGLVSEPVEKALAAGDTEELNRLARVFAERTGLRLTVLGPDSLVIADAGAPTDHLPGEFSDDPEVRALFDIDDDSERASRFNYAEPETLHLARRFPKGDELLGVVRITLPLGEIGRELVNAQWLVWSTAIAGVLLVVGVSGWLVAQIVNPLAQLIRGARAVSLGNYEREVRVSNRDELGLLGHAFSRMSRELYRHTEQLRQNGERLATVLGGMIEGVIAVDRDEGILFANGAASRLIGFEPSGVEGRPLWEAVRNPVVQKAVREAFTASEPVRRIEFEVTLTRRTVAMHATRLPGEPCPGVVLVLHDVTDLRRLENLRQEFVANVSHELKTPLTSIQAYTETLLGGALDDPEHNVLFVKRIEEQANRLLELILDVLRLARIESHPEKIEIGTVPLTEAVQWCMEQRQATAESKRIRLASQLPRGEIFVRAEEEGLQTVIDNLLSNALKYTPDGGEVTIRCRTEADEAVIEVEDNGIGIDPEQQPRIFERFYRADRARSRDLGGTGLGLSIVKHLVQTFGGSVAVESSIGSGSTFTVRIPLA